MADLERALVIGNGGREHELARQLAGSELVGQVVVAPGNAGTATMEGCENAALNPMDTQAVVDYVREKAIPWVVIGPEAPLVNGLADPLRDEGVLVFGPNKAAARLEGSKAFFADFVKRHNIPSPPSDTARNLEEALEFIDGRDPTKYVLKADGLAAGKGVVLPDTVEEAREALEQMFSGNAYEGAGKDAVVIQKRYHGPEVSAFVVTDGKNILLLPLNQDHKRLKDNDKGPNTGGMGAISPLPESIVSPRQHAKILEMAQLQVDGMAKDGMPFQGVLFMGLILARELGGDPAVIEDNVRFGDPEIEVMSTVLSNAGFDVADMMLQASKGDISRIKIPSTLGQTALTVALAAAGYPDSPRKGDEIHGLDKSYEGVFVHHAGTKEENGKIVTSGGRVLYVTGVGETADEAAARAYAAIGDQGIHFEGMQYRTDIGHQVRTAKK